MQGYVIVIFNFVECRIQYEAYISKTLTLIENINVLLNIVDKDVSNHYKNYLIITNEDDKYFNTEMLVEKLNLQNEIELYVY